MSPYCPKCGKEVPEGALYCPHCGRKLRPSMQKTGFPVASGILCIIASGIFIVALLFVMARNAHSYLFFWNIFLTTLVGFASGLAGGIVTLNRKFFAVAVSMAVVVLACSLYTMLMIPLFGVILLILSIISLIFIFVAKKEFT